MEIPALLAMPKEGETVKIHGTVHTIRDMGEVAFVVLRKRDGLLQCVYEEGTSKFDLKALKEEAAVELSGACTKKSVHPTALKSALTL